MKSLFYIVAVALLFSGCSYKNEVIKLQAYKADYAGEISQEKKSVFVNIVDDIRKDKKNIGYYMKDDKKAEIFFSDENFAAKYKDGLLVALNSAGFNIQTAYNNADIVVEVHIKKIEIVYSNTSFNENVKGEISIKVLMKNNGKVATQEFTQKAGKWIAPSHDSKDLEPFLNTLFSDSINGFVSKLTSL